MRTELPKLFRPQFYGYRRCVPGLDVPSVFFDNLQGIDENLYLVWHQYRLLWDNFINQDTGAIEDSRYLININYGHLNFGHVLVNRHGVPLLEQTEYDKEWNPTNYGAWHVWRLCKPASAWAHILRLESTEGDYLSLVINRLNAQARWSDRYGAKSYNRLLETMKEEEREQMMKDRSTMMQAFQTENKWFLKKAADNFASGVTRPTNPTREIITNLSNKKIVRPITDKEAGLWTPDA
jgi:hypothetical protein